MDWQANELNTLLDSKSRTIQSLMDERDRVGDERDRLGVCAPDRFGCRRSLRLSAHCCDRSTVAEEWV
jgi:hypothetical protein